MEGIMKKFILTSFFSLLFIHLMYANDGPNIWSTSLSGASQIWTIVINPVDPDIIYAGSNTTGIWKTTNAGMNWSQTNSGLTNTTVQALAISASNPEVLYCGTSQTGAGAGAYLSINAGATWFQINNGIVEASKGIQSIAVDQTNHQIAYIAVFDGVVDSQNGLYKTTNNGATWIPATTGIGAIKNILALAINPLNPDVVYCGTSFQVTGQTGPAKIYKSVNAGATWTDMSTGLPQLTTDIKPIRTINISDSDTSVVLAGLFLNTDSLGGMFVSTNGGGLWTRRHNGIPNAVGTLPRSSVIRPGSSTEFYVGIGNATNTNIGVYATSNAGLSWTPFNNGTLSNTTTVRALAFKKTADTTLYAGGAHPTLATGQGVFEYTWITTGIGNNTEIPSEYKLEQNYPNPFNPGTIISYSLKENGYVTLKVFDILGKEVAALVNARQNAGTYNVEWNAGNFSSGVYFYKLTTEKFSDTKRMMLLR
jgi:hypothetical protein